MNKRNYIFFILLLIGSLVFMQCSLDDMGLLDSSLDRRGGRLDIHSESSEGEISSNNLSVPVIWSDGIELPLPGVYGEELWNPDSIVDVGGVPIYPQQAGNIWRAESIAISNNGGDEEISIDYIDWGDNLEAKNWPSGAKIRVETVLFKSFTGEDELPQYKDGMTSYDMVFIEGQGKTESWGTNRDKKMYNHEGSPEPNALIYSGCAKLVIQKFTFDPVDCDWLLDSEYPTGRWDGDGIGDPIFDSGVWNTIDGPEGYSAEINIGGKVIYGFNWDTRVMGEGPGFYRITFALVDNETIVGSTLNTLIDDSTTILVAAEEEELTSLSEDSDSGEPDLGGGTPAISVANNLTYIDIELTSKGGGRR